MGAVLLVWTQLSTLRLHTCCCRSGDESWPNASLRTWISTRRAQPCPSSCSLGISDAGDESMGAGYFPCDTPQEKSHLQGADRPSTSPCTQQALCWGRPYTHRLVPADLLCLLEVFLSPSISQGCCSISRTPREAFQHGLAAGFVPTDFLCVFIACAVERPSGFS